MRRIGLLAAAVCLFSILGPSAWANPITDRVLRVQQVPHTQHVQVSYGVDTSVTTFANPSSLSRDTTDLSATWTSYSGFTANTGSGLATLQAAQWCDCNAPIGAHTYTAVATGGSLQAELTVVANLEYPADAGVVSPDADPWDIPEPVDIQGLDCNASCGGTAPDAGTPPPDAAVTPDAGVDPDDKDDGGCSLAGGLGSSTLLGLWLGLSLLLLAILTFRRRRK
ncbi:MAG: hypothetical protein RBU30_25905 [Polyangia bacterium]|jgi:hypothetical protein|nr:hypothetical protein [Polyangia bacterium]